MIPAACSESETSLCDSFDELVGATAAVASIDPTNETAAEATDAVDEYLAAVRALRQAADDRYGSQLEALETAVSDVRLTLGSVQDDADYATWGPLVADDLELAADAAVQVEQAIEPSCQPASAATETVETERQG